MKSRRVALSAIRTLHVALLATAAAARFSALSAQTIGINLGATGSVTVAPGASVTVPIIVDLASAGSQNITALQGSISWNAARLVFDSIRVVPSSGWTLTLNDLSSAAFGSVVLTATRATPPTVTGAFANAYFRTAGAGGARLLFAPFGAVNSLQQVIVSSLRTRGQDVCATVPGKWGDVNGDAGVNIADAQQIARASVGLSVTDPTAVSQRGDVTADGSVTIADAQQIARFSVGLSAAPRVNTDVFTAPVATSVTASPSSSQTIAIGASRQLVATPINGSTDHTGCAPTTWTSTNPAAAIVNSSGFVSAVGSGSAVIAVASGSASTQVSFTVSAVPVATVAVTLNSPSIATSGSTQANAVVRDAAGNTLTGRGVEWISTDPAVATVDRTTGVVRGVAAGTAGILGVSEGITGFATVTVTGGGGSGAPVATVTVSLGASSINIVATTQATAGLRDASGNLLTGRVVTWTSSNAAIASVNSSSGLVTGVTPGTAIITATSEGVTGQATITVTISTAPVASVTVALASGSIQPGGTTTATATMRDALNNVLAGRAVVWSSSNPLVATVNPLTGAILGIAVGTTNIVGVSEGVSGQAVLGVGLSNEPPGMTFIAERAFNCFKVTACETDWFTVEGVPNTFSVVVDSSAPRSSANVLQQLFTSALPGGSSPGAAGQDFPSVRQKGTIYAAYWMQLSSNWVGHQSNINKSVFFPVAANNRVYTMVQGTGTTGPMNVAIGLQGLPQPYTANGITGPSVNLTPNIVNVPIIRGVWHKYEVVFVCNTPGSANGTAEMWVDGIKVMQYSGIVYAAVGENARWEGINWGPIWGGAGGAITTPFYARMDHMYVSGK
jgi:uncharacterized protein YjdB